MENLRREKIYKKNKLPEKEIENTGPLNKDLKFSDDLIQAIFLLPNYTPLL